MVKSIKFITDTNHETVVDLLNPYGSKYLVVDIDGLGPVKASINGSKIAGNDGSVFNNAQIDTRNISFSFKIADTINGQYKPIWQTRRECYLDFPVKRPLRIEFTREDDSVLWIKGYVESCDPEFFSAMTMLTVSIICVDPFFREGENMVDEISNTTTPFLKTYGDYEEITPTDTTKYPKTLTKYQAFDMSTGKLFPYLQFYYDGDAYFGGDFESEFEKSWSGTAAQCVYSYELFPANWAATGRNFIYRSTQHQVGRCIMFHPPGPITTIEGLKQFWKKRSPNYILTNCDEESPETTWHTVMQKSTGIPGYMRESDGLFVPVTQMQVASITPGMYYETEYAAGVKLDLTINSIPSGMTVAFTAKVSQSSWAATTVMYTLLDRETGTTLNMSTVKSYFDSHDVGTWCIEAVTSSGTDPRRFVFKEFNSTTSFNGYEILTGSDGQYRTFSNYASTMVYNDASPLVDPTIPIGGSSCGNITIKNNDSIFLIFEDRLQYIDDALIGFQTGDVIKIDTSVGKRSAELVRTESIYGNEQHYNLISAMDRYSDWFAFISGTNNFSIETETEGVGISFKIEVPHIRGGV